MTHDFSPIDSEAKYKAALEYLMNKGSELAKATLSELITSDTLTIFAQTEAEYAFLDELIRTYGTKSRFTHGVTLYIDVDMDVAGHHVILLGVREPDDSRGELGYADFSVENYAQIRDSGNRYVHEITTARGQSLLELQHPDFDVRGYLVPLSEHGSLFDELCNGMETFHDKWHAFINARENKAFFESLRPTAVAWKVFDRAELDRCVANIRGMCDQIHYGWANERWLVSLHLKDDVLSGNVSIVKLMERRPGSTDPVGFDHVDFILAEGDVKTILAKEKDLKWTEERNGEHCKWLSLWFYGTEAKLRTDTVLQVCADEMLDVQKRVNKAHS
jgi:hypothetical protein